MQNYDSEETLLVHSFTKRSCFIRLDLCWADTKYGVDGSVPGDLTQPDDHEDHDLDFSFV